jgi:hypothetical protein
MDCLQPRLCLRPGGGPPSSRCHWCHMDIQNDTRPLGKPIRLLKDGTVVVSGAYCCMECVKAAVDATPYVARANARTAFHTYCKKLGMLPWEVTVAPHFTTRDVYGGTLSDEEFNSIKRRAVSSERFARSSIVELSRIDYFELVMPSDGTHATRTIITRGGPDAASAPPQAAPQCGTPPPPKKARPGPSGPQREDTGRRKGQHQLKSVSFSGTMTGLSRPVKRPRTFMALDAFSPAAPAQR